MTILFLRKGEVLALHSQLINQYGGSHGIRDESVLESALAAPENRYHYEEADLIACAATYAFHLTQAHAFIDGNKRVGAAAMTIFLQINGVSVDMPKQMMIALFMEIAASSLLREDVERLLRSQFGSGAEIQE